MYGVFIGGPKTVLNNISTVGLIAMIVMLR
jgi:hypothetical protein